MKISNYQELSCGLKIVKTVLSVMQSSGVVPGLAVFTSATNISDDHVTEMLGEEQMGDGEAVNKIYIKNKLTTLSKMLRVFTEMYFYNI
jgi:hypothetical protein